jgi:hypothetical protein
MKPYSLIFRVMVGAYTSVRADGCCQNKRIYSTAVSELLIIRVL